MAVFPYPQARELCEYFYSVDKKMEWDPSVEKFEVLETIDDVTNVTYGNRSCPLPSPQSTLWLFLSYCRARTFTHERAFFSCLARCKRTQCDSSRIVLD